MAALPAASLAAVRPARILSLLRVAQIGLCFLGVGLQLVDLLVSGMRAVGNRDLLGCGLDLDGIAVQSTLPGE